MTTKKVNNLAVIIRNLEHIHYFISLLQFEKLLDQIISVATYPLDDFKGNKDDPCLLVTMQSQPPVCC